MDIANILTRNEKEISQVEEEKLQQERMLGLFSEHPPSLDPEAVGRAMQWILHRIHDLEDKKRSLLQEKEALHVDLAFALESNRGGNGDNKGN
ncbi:hypothetical protein MKW98_028749 [Papaver atlanticum]|uniref:Uncharacterized protein n=1 Tax=Papaver atlanticum TaxID=357466 RepID=A0AAD4XBS6_9MAGN|nr:hypothetical protein MKW98_028749 [Papaver atlanticum]